MLDMTLKDVERVLYFESYIVTEPGITPLKAEQLLTEEEYLAKRRKNYGDDSFTAEHRRRGGSRTAREARPRS